MQFVSSEIQSIVFHKDIGTVASAANEGGDSGVTAATVGGHLTKEGEGWQMHAIPSEEQGGTQKADDSKVSGLLATLSSLRAEGFIDENKAEKIAEWGDPIFSLKLSSGATGQEVAFYRDLTETDFIYAVTTLQSPLYRISRNRFEEISKPISFFKEETGQEKESVLQFRQ